MISLVILIIGIILTVSSYFTHANKTKVTITRYDDNNKKISKNISCAIFHNSIFDRYGF